MKAGDKYYCTELANSLEAIAEGGSDVFYKGEVGQKLIADIQGEGGLMTMEDLESYQ